LPRNRISPRLVTTDNSVCGPTPSSDYTMLYMSETSAHVYLLVV
jgi:hypothetical protein